MGWSTLTVPNRVEKELYLRSNTDKLKGVVMMCLSLCTMRQCANGDLRLDQVGKGLQIKVNGELATKAVAVGDLCFLLMPSSNGLEFGSDNGTFRFEIRANRLSDDFVSHVRLSSLIVM